MIIESILLSCNIYDKFKKIKRNQKHYSIVFLMELYDHNIVNNKYVFSKNSNILYVPIIGVTLEFLYDDAYFTLNMIF